MELTWKAAVAAIVLCSSMAFPQDKPAPATPAKTAASPASEKEATPAANPLAGPEYVIGPEDVLHVAVWNEANFTETVPVRPDGKISLPLINDVQAAGLTADQLTADLTERFKKFISQPQVTVIVTQVNSQRIYVMGEVLRGGTYPLLPGMTVLQGLSDAGGFTPFANPKKTYVLRDNGGKQEKLPFDYKAVVKGKNPEQNVPLMAGDTIVVHDDLYGRYPGAWAHALDEVKRRGLEDQVDMNKLQKAVEEKTGVPTYIMPGPPPDGTAG
jgi:polysaccharide export outer membrane protein